MSTPTFQEVFDLVTMQRLLEVSFGPQQFMRKTFFSNVNKSATKYIQVDKYKHSRKLAAFVSPIIQGKLVERKGYTTDVFTPPYIKEKRVSRAYEMFMRPMGQNPYTPNKSPRTRAMGEMGRDLTELDERLQRRIEHDCCTLMLTGTLNLQGDGVDLVYDFGFPSANLWTVTNGKISLSWANSSADILGDIEDACDEIKKNTGRIPNIVILGRNMYKHFRSNEDIRALLDNRRILAGQMKIDLMPKGVTYIGNIGEIDYYQYVEYYEDDSGTLQNMFDPDTVLVTSTDLRSSLEFGAIQDLDFGMNVPAEKFAKTWREPDPSAQVVLLQSAPLPVHHQLEGNIVMKPTT